MVWVATGSACSMRMPVLTDNAVAHQAAAQRKLALPSMWLTAEQCTAQEQSGAEHDHQ